MYTWDPKKLDRSDNSQITIEPLFATDVYYPCTFLLDLEMAKKILMDILNYDLCFNNIVTSNINYYDVFVYI